MRRGKDCPVFLENNVGYPLSLTASGARLIKYLGAFVSLCVCVIISCETKVTNGF